MSSAQHLILLLIVIIAAIAVLISSVMSLVAFYKDRPMLKKLARVVFWISFVIMLIFLKIIDAYK